MRCVAIRTNFLSFLFLLGLIWLPGMQVHAWESALYPKDWEPGFADSEGRFLHDFSYAGYHRGEIPIPTDIPGAFVDVTVSPYGADWTGFDEATQAIQKAIDDVGAQGGGVVYLPEGTYRLKLQSGKNYALWIHDSGVVLRGAGSGKTFLFIDETYTRKKRLIKISPESDGKWHSMKSGTRRDITFDLLEPTTEIPVTDVSGFAAGDWIVVRADATDAFIAEHDMDGKWDSSLKGPIFYRQIVAVNPVANTIIIDIPTRYYLEIRDNARIYKIAGSHLEEIGLEDFSIGMRENPKDGWDSGDNNVAGTGAYDVRASYAIEFRHLVNSWLQRVDTFRPDVNIQKVHIHSNGVRLYQTRSITVRDSNFSHPQSEAGGVNGYCFVAVGSDSLFENNVAVSCRSAFSLKNMWASGNVFLRNLSKDSMKATGFIKYLSMANLFDNHVLDNDLIEARYRTSGSPQHGHSTTQSVIWNTQGLAYTPKRDYIVWSAQFGDGYVIGTRGPADGVKSSPTKKNSTWVDTAPEDWVEGVGQGGTLAPQSLYEDQLARRVAPEPETPTNFNSASDSSLSGSDPADAVPPEVALTLKLGNLVPLTIIVDATDDVALSHAEIYIDGGLEATLLGDSPYSYDWTLPNKKTHEILVKAYDRAGNASTDDIRVKRR